VYDVCFFGAFLAMYSNTFRNHCLEFQIEGPIHSSNVMLYSKEKNVASRVGHTVLDNGKKVRYLIKTGEVIDSVENWKKLKEATKQNEAVVAA